MQDFLQFFSPVVELIKTITEILKQEATIVTTIAVAGALSYKFWRWLFPKPEKASLVAATVEPARFVAAQPATTTLTVRPIASPEELREVYDFDENAYADRNDQHVDNIPFETFEEWWNAWPDGFIAAFDDGEPVCVIGVFPVTRAWAEGLLRREHDEKNLHHDSIAEADRTIWYLAGISAKSPGGEGLHSAVPVLLTHTLVQWYLKNRDVLDRTPIRIISVGVSRMGVKLLERIGFLPAVRAKAAGEFPIFSREVSRDRLLRFLNENPLLSRYFNGEVKIDLEEALKDAPPLQQQKAAFEPMMGG